jgi:hypothetical protein
LRASRAVGEAMKKKGGEAMKKKSDGAMKKIIKVYREIKRVEVFDDYIVEVCDNSLFHTLQDLDADRFCRKSSISTHRR